MARKVTAVIDLQFGSTGKGLIAGYLAERDKPDTIVTAWAANAGHTYINKSGRKFIHTMLANGVVSPNLKRIMIGPGSVIDPDNLLKEILSCIDLLQGVSIYVHANVAVITQLHRDEEAGPMTKIGSTKKGCGASAIQRIRRDPDNMNTADPMLLKNPAYTYGIKAHPVSEYVEVLHPEEYSNILDRGEVIQVEGAQGFSLSMYHGFYPYCTSRDVTTAQLMADCGIPMSPKWAEFKIIGTVRTFPIRVANRYDEKGKQVGWSGPCFPDQEEITFESIGQNTELTTVTKLPRRIFTFSKEQVRQAIRQCGVDEIFLNFANYCRSDDELVNIMKDIQLAGASVRYIGWGPTVTDVIDLWDGLADEGNQND